MNNKKAVIRNDRRITAVDLFCGVGGLTHGLIKGGIRVNAGVDLDSSCRVPYEKNNDAVFIEGDLRKIKAKDIEPYFAGAKIRLLAGCAPCQPFSTYSQKGRSSRSDGKWDLLLDFGRLVRAVQPELVTMENVPQLYNHQVFEKFIRSLNGYNLWYGVVDCVEYGIPQTRKRLVLLGSKLGGIDLISPTHTRENSVSVRAAISHLPAIVAGASHDGDRLHTACSLSDLNARRIKASRPGGTWRDWPEELRADCHNKKSGETYPSVYGRMEWDAPAPTMTTQCFGYGNGRFGHPEQDRAISLREAAMIQTFPEGYVFLSDREIVKFNVLGRLIGNAVPVRLGEVIALSLKAHLKKISN